MKKIWIIATFLFCICFSVFADQNTTVLTMQTKCSDATGILPYIDGANDINYQNKANNLIMATMREMVKSIGNNGSFSYSVQLNRASVVSILLKAQNGKKVCYKSLNIDLTDGQEFAISEFFVNDEKTKQIFGDFKSFVFTEQGVFLQTKKDDKYDKFVPFSDIMSSVRIGEAGRLFQIAKLTRKSENKILIVPKYNLIAIKLDANSTTGYKWDAELPPNGEIIKVGSSYIMRPLEKEQVGVPGNEVLFFSPVTSGKYIIKMFYHRAWEKFNVDQFQFTVVVTD